MSMKKWWRREVFVAIHAQSVRFRIIKYIILITIAVVLYRQGGWPSVGWIFLGLLIVSLAIHVLFRWKTNAWTRSWGPYKKIRIPD